MFWQLVVLAAALGSAYYRWSRRRLYRLAEEIPSGIKEYPIVGHAYKFIGSSEGVTDPAAIEVVSKTCLDKDEYILKFIKAVIGNASIFASVNIWQPRRKILTPFFKLKNLNQLVQVFQKKSSIVVDLLQTKAGGGDFPLWTHMTTFSFDTVFESVLRRHANSQEDPSHFFLVAIDEVLLMLAARMMQPWLHPDFIYERLPVYKRFYAHRKRCWDFCDEVIKEKRTELRAGESKTKKDNGWTSFLDTAIQSSGRLAKGYSDLELREELLMMVVAGNDTIGVSGSFTAVMLSRYPGVQDRVYQELHAVFGESEREVIAKDLPKLKYLEAVIKETLRLYPPVPVVMRELHDDIVLPSGVMLVKGTSININIWGTHRNPAYWGADAELFRPERFLEGPLRHPAMFIPFSYSVRNCAGATYAMLSLKTALANLLRRYRLLPPTNMAAADRTQPLRVKFGISMKAIDDFIVRVEDRKKTY